MRLRLAGKLVLFALALAGLYLLWSRVPREHKTWRMPSLDRFRPVARSVGAAQGLARAEGEPEHAGVLIGYAGTPPPAAVSLGAPAVTASAALSRKAGVPVGLRVRDSARSLLDDVEAGRLDAAVVDFPSVVYAARRGRPGFRVVLLVSWRKGADAITVRGGAPWEPAQATDFEPGTSGEYLARRALVSSRFSPRQQAVGTRRLDAGARRAGKGLPAASSGRLDRMPRNERLWPVWMESDEIEAPMPDVLIVNERFARRDPKRVTGIVAGWLQDQKAIQDHPDRWQTFLEARSRTLQVTPEALDGQLLPAPLEDQLAFVGLLEKGIPYTALVVQQMKVIEHGPRPPKPDFIVPVDPQPLAVAVEQGAVARS